jgi:excisionase family DNA binding protein
VTVASAISLLGLGKTKLYELLGNGELEAIRVGRRTLILQASIDALVERLRSSQD